MRLESSLLAQPVLGVWGCWAAARLLQAQSAFLGIQPLFVFLL